MIKSLRIEQLTRLIKAEEQKGKQMSQETNSKKKKRDTLQKMKYFPWIFILILIIYLVYSGTYTVNETSQAVVQTLGRYSYTREPGLHFKLPWPIQTVTILPVQSTQKMELGYYQDDTGEYHSEEDDSLMITADMNVVNIDFFLEWKISDPYKFLFASENPEAVLRNLLMSSVRSVVGTKSIDDALVTGKYEIQNEVQDMLMEKLAVNDIGVQILDVKVNDSEPPIEEVARAFRDVETAKQEKDMAINKANEYKNRRLPAARAKADEIVRAAEAYKERRIAEAEGLRDRYLAIYEEYKNFPEISKKRMYMDILQKALPNINLIIDEAGDVSKYMPLNGAGKSEQILAQEEAEKAVEASELGKGGK